MDVKDALVKIYKEQSLGMPTNIKIEEWADEGVTLMFSINADVYGVIRQVPATETLVEVDGEWKIASSQGDPMDISPAGW